MAEGGLDGRDGDGGSRAHPSCVPQAAAWPQGALGWRSAGSGPTKGAGVSVSGLRKKNFRALSSTPCSPSGVWKGERHPHRRVCRGAQTMKHTWDLRLRFHFIMIFLHFFFFKIFWCGPFFKSLLNLLQYCFCFMSWFLGPKACGILTPWPGIEPAPSALEGKVLVTGPPGKCHHCIHF